ncbi:MAG: EVE domain-containing protein [Methylophilaceae bacterium]
MRYWLMKSEPTDFSIDDLETSPNQTIDWYGIRNYQARNFMRDDMSLGDQAFFYHSNCKAPGIVGIMEVSRLAYPDRLQHIKGHKYYDPKSSPDNPRWLNVDVKFVKKTKLLELKDIRSYEELKEMKILQRGNRLSITPISPEEWQFIYNLIAY